MTLRAECQSVRMSETENGRLGLDGAEHSKYDHMMALGFKVLNCVSVTGRQSNCWVHGTVWTLNWLITASGASYRSEFTGHQYQYITEL